MNNSFEYADVFFAYLKAKKSRKDKQEIYMFDQNREQRLKEIYEELKNQTYKHSSYKKIIINDSKKRYIYSPCLRDHIVHHLLYEKIYKSIDNNFLDSTFACRKGYGSHKAIGYLHQIIQTNIENNKTYYLKIDYSKYFFSIHHDILKFKLMNFIQNADLYYIASMIIDSYITSNLYDNLLHEVTYYINTKQKGLPIGSITSQLFANFYLDEIDKYIKNTLGLDFVRYMDDIILLGTKDELQQAKKGIIELSVKNSLIVHPKKVSFNLISDGVSFVGYKIKNNKIYVSKGTKNKTNKYIDILKKIDMSVLKQKDSEKLKNILASRMGNFTHSSFGLNYFKNHFQ